MPRNVRNFWLEARIDGRASCLSGGPVSKDGGIYLVIRQRDNGIIMTACRISGVVLPDGKLRLIVETENPESVTYVDTVR